jgi:glycosyltransferase involved in cell wall biosynthesis
VADSADAFADAVIQLLREPERAARLAANARRHAEERFDWRVIGNDLARILRDAVNAARDAAPEIRLDHAPV